MLTVTPGEIPIPQLHQFLIGSVAPRPICFASTIDENGNPNLAPFSFFNVFSANPPILVFAPNNSGRDGTPKHTFLNVQQVPEVVINMVNEPMMHQMNVAAAPWARGENEFEKSGFTPLKSDVVRPFRVAESPVQIECKVLEIKSMGTGGGAGNLVICQVLKMHISDEVLSDEGKIDQRKMKLLGRLGGSWYCNTESDNLFELSQPMQKTIGYDNLPVELKNSHSLTANELGQLASLPIELSEEVKLLVADFKFAENKHQLAKEYIQSGKPELALALFL